MQSKSMLTAFKPLPSFHPVVILPGPTSFRLRPDRRKLPIRKSPPKNRRNGGPVPLARTESSRRQAHMCRFALSVQSSVTSQAQTHPTASPAPRKSSAGSGPEFRPCRSESDKVGNRDQRNTDGDNKKSVGNEVRKDHERHPANQWHDGPLPFSVHEEAEPNRAEEQAPKKPRLVHCVTGRPAPRASE